MRCFLAVGLLAWICASRASAQRFSVNAVGYVDRDLVPGVNLVANPLNAGDNSISNLLRTVPDGSLLFPWDKTLQAFGPTNRFVAGQGWVPGTGQLPGGEGAYLWLPTPTHVTFVGEPWTYSSLSSLCTTFPVGFSLSSIWPLLQCGLCGFTDPCPAAVPDSTVVYRWDPATQSYRTHVFIGGFGWDPEEPRLAPGEAAQFGCPLAFSVRAPGTGGMVPSVRLVRPRHQGTNFAFQFWAEGSVDHSLRRSTDLNSDRWETMLTQSGPPGGGWVTVTDPAPTNAMCFYRLDCLRLLRPVRNGTTFSFQFHAEAGVSYRVSRKVSLADPTWLTVLTIPASPGGGLVTATDVAATNSTGYYRVED